MSKLEQFVSTFPWVQSDTTPFSKLTKDLSTCKVAVVSTGGLYMAGNRPFSIVNREDVDESFREIPLSCPISKLHVAHEHFNKAHSQQDLNVIFPVERMQALASEGFIGSVAETNFSITGYIPRPNKLFAAGKAIAEALLAQEVDAVIMVPVWPICQQSGGLVAREIEATGIPTVTLSLIPEIIEVVGIPRALVVRNPFGSPVGAPGNTAQQLRVLKEALGLLVSAVAPKTALRSGEQYRPAT